MEPPGNDGRVTPVEGRSKPGDGRERSEALGRLTPLNDGDHPPLLGRAGADGRLALGREALAMLGRDIFGLGRDMLGLGREAMLGRAPPPPMLGRAPPPLNPPPPRPPPPPGPRAEMPAGAAVNTISAAIAAQQRSVIVWLMVRWLLASA